MSTYRACAIAGRVVMIHDMDDRTAISELEADQAGLLLQQLEIALRAVLRQDTSYPEGGMSSVLGHLPGGGSSGEG